MVTKFTGLKTWPSISDLALISATICMTAGSASNVNAETRFFTKLRSGENPTLFIIGNSTSQQTLHGATPGDPYNANTQAPGATCNKTLFTRWPGHLKAALLSVGNFTLTGNTCPAYHSGHFIDSSLWPDGLGLNYAMTQRPDAVIIEFATGTDCESKYNMTVEQSRSNHEIIIDSLLSANPDMDIYLWNSVRSWGLSWTTRSTRPASSDSQAVYAQMMVDLAEARGENVHVIETYSQFSELYRMLSLEEYQFYVYDGNHNHELAAAEVIVPEILYVMKKPALRLVTPREGHRFYVGNVMPIQWKFNPDSVVGSIEISYSPDAGETWLAITSVNNPQTRYEWTIPELLNGVPVVSADARIKINDYVADGFFDQIASVVIRPAGTEPIVIDDQDSTKVEFIGTWTRATAVDKSAYYGAYYSHDNNEGKGTKEVTYTPGLEAGDYTISLLYYVWGPRATNIPVVIRTAGGYQTVTVDQNINGGKWNSIGDFTLDTDATVTIKNEGTSALVVADAVKFDPVIDATTATQRHGNAMQSAQKSTSRIIAGSTVTLPAGVSGFRLYTISGRRMYEASGIGDISKNRVISSPMNTFGMSVGAIEFLRK